MINTLNQDTASKFYRPSLSAVELEQAMQVSPLFLAYLQTKIESYATALVDTIPTYDPNPSNQVAAILAVERLRSFCSAYEELLSELIDAAQNMDSPTSR